METRLKIKNKQWHLLVLLLILSVVGCKDDKDDSGTSAIYDPSQPVTITSFTPESGAGGAQFLVYGNNFGSNLRNIKVTVNDKEAVLISSNGTCIYCFVPRKAGVGKVKVSVGTGDNTQEVGILYLLEDYQGLRKIDLVNEQVLTLWRTGSGVNHPRSISFNSDHSKLYIFNDQDSSDEGVAVAVSERSKDPKKEDFTSWSAVARMKSCCGGYVHPETNDIFFNRWNGGEYYKWNFQTNDKEQIFRVDNQFNSGLMIAPSGNFGYIVSMGHNCIYRTNFDYATGKFMQPYLLCGNKSTNGGYADGPGTTAQFDSPQQGCFDENDNFYICDQGNSIIRKVEPNGQVTTFAGRRGEYGLADGDLRLEAQFNRPHGIAYNQNTGEFYIADKNNKRIRIITKE